MGEECTKRGVISLLCEKNIFRQDFTTMWDSLLLKGGFSSRNVSHALLYAEMREWATKKFGAIMPADFYDSRNYGGLQKRNYREIRNVNEHTDNIVAWPDRILPAPRSESVVKVACVAFVLGEAGTEQHEVGAVYLRFRFPEGYPFTPPAGLAVWQEHSLTPHSPPHITVKP